MNQPNGMSEGDDSVNGQQQHNTSSELGSENWDDDAERYATLETNGLNAHRDVREIIRLIQCSICSFPLRNPMTLPCGNTVCRNCLPATFPRQCISYPNTPGRQEGFICCFPECSKEHPLADCGLDFTLKKVIDAVEEQLGQSTNMPEDSTVRRGLVQTYVEAREGRLPYDAELDDTDEKCDSSQFEILKAIKRSACPEMECQVCYGLLFDPVTTYCGHTFCRRCLQRVLDHSQLCPSCRQHLQLPSVLPASSSNKRLTEILVGLCPDTLAQRADTVAMEEKAGSADDELDTALFVCTPSFPGMPTPLFIFEPRYRLMIRRAWEDSRTFGMVIPNKTGEPQGDLGITPFMEYGTLLQIEQIHVYPDGRSHIWTVGVGKFKVKKWGFRDDYIVAKTERLDDLPLAEEEALEAFQTARITPTTDLSPPWSRLSTQALLHACHGFVDHMQALSAPWLHESNILAFGPRPDDPVMFPYWLATVLPIADEEKYKLIASTSVRERLLVAVSWIKRLENNRWLVLLELIS
ncbi:PUA-like domain-containing protein [Geopyxis carbonaria]|nr:PUA-like domain-containing protein [Geopyxis carbonaria]